VASETQKLNTEIEVMKNEIFNIKDQNSKEHKEIKDGLFSIGKKLDDNLTSLHEKVNCKADNAKVDKVDSRINNLITSSYFQAVTIIVTLFLALLALKK
jgi:hypothetical protein